MLWERACRSVYDWQGHLATPRESPAKDAMRWRRAMGWRTVQALGMPAQDSSQVVSSWHRGAEDAMASSFGPRMAGFFARSGDMETARGGFCDLAHPQVAAGE